MKYLDLQERNIVMIGFGSIGRAVLPLILRHLVVKPDHIRIIAADAENQAIAEAYGTTFTQFELTENNYDSFLSPQLHPGDIMLNLSVGISSLDLIRLCERKQVLYLDTSNEIWLAETRMARTTLLDRRLDAIDYAKQQAPGAPTALICHGANPGLISHFAKKAMIDVCKATEQPLPDMQAAGAWGQLAHQLGVVTLHIAEKDSQHSKVARQTDEYVNTWSIPGFLDEASEYAGFAWGTHESELPTAQVHRRLDTGTCRAIELESRGFSTVLHSWVPSFGAFHGFLIPHHEAFSLAELFSCHPNEQAFYQPTVHFVYAPCPDAQLSMYEAAANGWAYSSKNRLIFDDIIDGVDELGILILRKDSSQVYWYGSRLDVHEARRLVPYNNATSLQVAAGVFAGLVWIIENPTRGIVEAEQADYERILEIAGPYLGDLVGAWSTWEGPAQDKLHWRFTDLLVNPE